jgi:hypothetical protein
VGLVHERRFSDKCGDGRECGGFHTVPPFSGFGSVEGDEEIGRWGGVGNERMMFGCWVKSDSQLETNIVQNVILQIGYQRVKCIHLCVFFA